MRGKDMVEAILDAALITPAPSLLLGSFGITMQSAKDIEEIKVTKSVILPNSSSSQDMFLKLYREQCSSMLIQWKRSRRTQSEGQKAHAQNNTSNPTSRPGRLLYVDTFEMPLPCGSTKSTMPVKARASGPTPPHLPTCPALTRHGLGWVTRTGGTRSRAAADGWQRVEGASRSGRKTTGTASAAPAGRFHPLPLVHLPC